MASAPTSGNRYSRSRADAGWAACACDHLASSGLREDVIVTKRAAAMGSGAADARTERPVGLRGVSSFLVLVRRLGISSFAGP
jgi:hypothetical protein